MSFTEYPLCHECSEPNREPGRSYMAVFCPHGKIALQDSWGRRFGPYPSITLVGGPVDGKTMPSIGSGLAEVQVSTECGELNEPARLRTAIYRRDEAGVMRFAGYAP